MLNLIKSVLPGSPAQMAGIKAGERLLLINGNTVADVLDYMYFAYDGELELTVSDIDGTERVISVVKEAGEDCGLEFEEYLMDSPRSCANNCIFCFVDQLPKGLRETLYFKDDDVRLSFLTGSYITLTNMSEREVERIIALKISPINVSVHTTDPQLRSKMLGNRNGGRGLEIMKRFAQAGIVMNCQIVCCPGWNDGDELKRTMSDLTAMYPAVPSVSVIPVGLTKHREGLTELMPFDKLTAEKVVDDVEKYGAECLKKHGSRIFFPSDEFYLKAEREIPEEDFYEDYPQLENGVGLLRLLIDDFMSSLSDADRPRRCSRERFSIATGVSAAPFMEKLLNEAKKIYPHLHGQVYAVENDFFGRTVDVAGLITGGDLIRQLKGKKLGSRLLITNRMLRTDENVFLDDITTDDVSRELGVRVIPIGAGGESLLRAIVKAK